MEKNNILNEENQTDISFLMDGILKKYGLEEDPNKMYQKIKNGERPNKTIVSYLTKDLAENKIDQKSFLLSLQKQFSLSEEISKKIIYDVKNIYLPLLKKVLERKTNIVNITDKLEVSEQEKDRYSKKTVQDRKTKSGEQNKYREPIE